MRDHVAVNIQSWHRALLISPERCHLLFLGDSTSSSSWGFPYRRVRDIHTRANAGLAGMVGDEAHIPDGGFPGLTLAGFNADVDGAYSSTVELYARADAVGGLLHVVLCLGINDLKRIVDQLGNVDVPYLEFQALLKSVVARLGADMPNLTITLRVPNGATKDDVGSHGYVTSATGEINPPGGAQALTEALRSAYLACEGMWSNVVVWDSQERVFGRVAGDSCRTDLFDDQIHPSVSAYEAVVDDLIANVIGVPRTQA